MELWPRPLGRQGYGDTHRHTGPGIPMVPKDQSLIGQTHLVQVALLEASL